MHIEVDLDVLVSAARNLEAAVDVARQVHDHRSSLEALAAEAGSAHLEDAIRSALGRWGYGMGLIVEDADQLAAMLREADRTYRRVEGRIAGTQP